MRLALGIEYDGTLFHGWQAQTGQRTVQHCLEQALSRVANHPVTVIVAGRTDAGVHASGQVVHFDSDAQRAPRSWILGANSHLPSDVAIQWVQPVADDFHARFSALSRHYRYTLYNRPVRSPLTRHRGVWERRPLVVEAMATAAACLVGTHDFSSFRAAGCQAKSPIRTLHRLTVERQGDQIILDAVANAFLHHMVRNLAGVLITIGAGERPVEWAEEVLARRDRTLGGVTAPPEGLCLLAVEYPACCFARLESAKYFEQRWYPDQE